MALPCVEAIESRIKGCNGRHSKARLKDICSPTSEWRMKNGSRVKGESAKDGMIWFDGVGVFVDEVLEF